MTIRHRDRTRPGDDSKDVDCGPATGVTHNYVLMAKTIDTEPRRIRPSFLQGVNPGPHNVGISVR